MARANALDRHYKKLDRNFRIVDRTRDYAGLVVPNGNAHAPIHGWFFQKESFAAALLRAVLIDLRWPLQNGVLLDPFCGSGTSLVAASELPSVFKAAYGSEINPFLAFVAQTKTRRYDVSSLDLVNYGEAVVAAAQEGGPAKVPPLSTFSDRRFFSRSRLRKLLQLKRVLQQTDAMPGSLVDLGRLALAGSIEPASQLRKDGRALRHEPLKRPVDPFEEFLRRLRIIARDVATGRSSVKVRVAQADGRHAGAVLPPGVTVDLTLFSPPYPNNIDYTEVYKLEAWLLSLIPDQQAFRDARLASVRSHASLLAPDEAGMPPEVLQLIQPLLDAIPVDRYQAGRRQIIHGYFRDMHTTLASVRDRASKGARVVFVVGNSLHGNAQQPFPVAADTLIAAIALQLGFSVEEIAVARRPARRTPASNWIRESVVFMKAG